MNNFLVFFALCCVVLILVLVACNYLYEQFGHGTTPHQPAPVVITPWHWEMYCQYLRVLIECIDNNYDSCRLVRPGDFAQHVAPNQKGVISKDGKIFFLAYFERRSSMQGGLKLIYDTTPTSVMANKLNFVFSNYCIKYGLTPISIVAARDVGDGRVCFLLELVP